MVQWVEKYSGSADAYKKSTILRTFLVHQAGYCILLDRNDGMVRIVGAAVGRYVTSNHEENESILVSTGASRQYATVRYGTGVR